MAIVLNRITKELRRSVHTPDFPEVDWIYDPDLSAVEGFPSKHWIIAGNMVLLKDKAARDADDAQEAAQKAADVAQKQQDRDDIQNAFVTILMPEINKPRAQVDEMTRTWMGDS